ncbi:4-hydroxy-tetrahydrodipicolinate reductase [Nesterenkonia alkaliphila]|uniref:4-hydroxy-tetrahydrodipicolinate reductase n=1 Tax=Nesterenkonia alkaliphila TaxID=1463631 RepID=A0A7K1UID1_9MICC|nr:4-hydroxy-tetrahydrodipicolinate reductase [Nesterenkonia alkaliphila]MVT26209.1 4-hydroxy-tetrahydrodipicolinate reductase [Nesterenkonia alkaliphila]GFZ84478.1 4-hydroxy-tetrahydrodipicolinate reductase [Nesterenkonia alkaliphila]
MSEQIRVAVLGAGGRMGSEAVRAVQAAPDMQLVAQLGRHDPLEQIIEAGATHLVDLTVPDVTEANVRFGLANGIHAVVGTSGWDEQRRSQLAALIEQSSPGVVIAPNFALGSVLASAFAAIAAPYFESAEIIELHHPTKVDAPSGTAVRTAELVGQARRAAGLGPSPDATQSQLEGARGAQVAGVNVHSVRLRGLTAHQETLFGNPSEQLTLRHDSFDRAGFMPGVLLALREVASRPGQLIYGLDRLLRLDRLLQVATLLQRSEPAELTALDELLGPAGA